MLVIGDDAALRYRGEHGEISRSILSGHDPFRIGVDGEAVNVLEIVIVDVPARRGPIKTQANIFMTTRAGLSSDFGNRVLEALAPRVPLPISSLNIRHDDWFIADTSFPIVHPFAISAEPPSAEQLGVANAQMR